MTKIVKNMHWLLIGNYGSLKTLGPHSQTANGGETPINKESNIWEKNLLKMKVK